MKTYLMAGLAVLALASSGFAQTFTTPANTNKTARPRTAPISKHEVTGVVPRALRGGNPLQMLNPRAPARYGTSQESVSLDPHTPGKWRGIKLFTFLF